MGTAPEEDRLRQPAECQRVVWLCRAGEQWELDKAGSVQPGLERTAGGSLAPLTRRGGTWHYGQVFAWAHVISNAIN